MTKIINFFINKTTIKILTDCSVIWDTALGDAFLLAIKYPLRQEEIPIKVSEKGKILSAGTARISPKSFPAIKSAPK